MLRSLSCSQPIRSRIGRRTVIFCFNLLWNSQILVPRSQRQSNSTSFHHCVKIRFSDAQCCQALKRRYRFQCGYQSELPIPSCPSSRLESPQKRCPRRLWSSQHVSVCDISALLRVFPTRYRATRFNEKIEFTNIWSKCFAVSAICNRSWARSDSLMQADLYRVASSFIRIGLRLPSNTSLSCSFSRGVVTALVFVLHPDSLMMSGAVSSQVQMSKH